MLTANYAKRPMFHFENFRFRFGPDSTILLREQFSNSQ